MRQAQPIEKLSSALLLRTADSRMTKIALWVSDMDAQIHFYSRLFDVTAPMPAGGFASVANDENAVLLHQLPSEYAAEVPLESQLPQQSEVAIKPVFRVDSIDVAIARVAASFATFTDETAIHGGFTYVDGCDPEGNVIQLEQAN